MAGPRSSVTGNCSHFQASSELLRFVCDSTLRRRFSASSSVLRSIFAYAVRLRLYVSSSLPISRKESRTPMGYLLSRFARGYFPAKKRNNYEGLCGTQSRCMGAVSADGRGAVCHRGVPRPADSRLSGPPSTVEGGPRDREGPRGRATSAPPSGTDRRRIGIRYRVYRRRGSPRAGARRRDRLDRRTVGPLRAL